MDIANAIAISVSIVGAAVAVASLVSSWRTSRSAAMESDVSALRGIIQALRTRITELEAEWQEKYDELAHKFDILCAWLRERGDDPDRIIEEGLKGG